MIEITGRPTVATIEVRPANTKDWPAIDCLIEQACKYENVPLTILPDLPGRKIFVADNDTGQVIGMVAAFPQACETQLSYLFILEEYRGRSLGSALLQSVINAFAPGTKFALLMERRNTPLRRFFKRNGFRRSHFISMVRTPHF